MGKITDLNIEELKKLAEPAPFGKGNKTVYDEKVRKASEIKGNCIELSGDYLPKVKSMAPLLGQIEAKLHKLCIYEKGGFFSEHADTQRSEKHIGTLVVCLPVPHTGGALIVSDDGNKEIFSFEELIKEKNKIP